MSAHYWRGVTVVTVTLPEVVPPEAEGLAVYWVGQMVCVAAYSRGQALELALVRGGSGEVWLACEVHLDREWHSLDGQALGTLRAVLGSMHEPGCIVAPGYWRGLDE